MPSEVPWSDHELTGPVPLKSKDWPVGLIVPVSHAGGVSGISTGEQAGRKRLTEYWKLTERKGGKKATGDDKKIFKKKKPN